MTISRIHCSQSLKLDSEIILPTPAAHHLIQVLRHKKGNKLRIFNDCDGEFYAEILSISPKKVVISIFESIINQKESPIYIHLGQAISRGDRMDYAIQKAVELGINEITPVLATHCNVKYDQQREKSRLLHWQKIAVSAGEQCGRLTIPTINPIVVWQDWLEKNSGDRIICSPDCRQSLFQNASAPERVLLLIGPEGGFSAEELEQALQDFSCRPLFLGPRILRTETASVAALTLLQYHWGDLSASPALSGIPAI